MIRISINLYYTGDCGGDVPLNYIICANCAGSKKCKGACHRRLRDCQFENDSGICRSCTISAASRPPLPNQSGAGPSTLPNSTQSAPSTSGYLAPPPPSNSFRPFEKFLHLANINVTAQQEDALRSIIITNREQIENDILEQLRQKK